MKIGSIDVDILTDGYFHLDGGAMFGVVPRPLWERKLPPDERNRVRLALRSLLIRAGGKTVIVDTGIGDKLSSKEAEIYRLERDGGLVSALAAHGLRPEDVDVVVDSHLHFDHCGGNTIRQGDQVVPTFPNAEYWIQRVEWDDAIHPNERTRTTYLAENLTPVADSGQLRLVEGSTEILPGVRWLATPGHTRAHTSVVIESGHDSAIYTVDVCPFVAHLERIAWVAAVDTEPLISMETKRSVIADALANNRLVLFDHDPNVLAARLSGTPEKYEVVPEIRT
ncbi:MAG TPA: MBL fold metallo-hydrolase [Chloroflexota bacterium]|nr:MBL fold metallo-hydrolase [Chloroflexota bacterium]